MSAVLETLYKSGNLTSSQSESLFAEVFSGNTDPAVFASLLTALKIKGETPDEIAGAATAMVKAARVFPRDASYEVGEIVGTGGDGMHSINISSMTALCAAANGLKIAKHGNRSVSSQTGASDLLASLGFDISPAPEDSAKLLNETGFAFCFAQLYHPAMKNVMPVRRALATRTIFNILGPLTNPAHPDYAVIGVYTPELLEPVARTLKALGMKRAFVVYGSGFDEVCVHGTTEYAHLEEDGTITTGKFTPADFGITAKYTEEDFKGGVPEENAKIALRILAGRGTDAQRDVVCANLAVLLMAAGKTKTLLEGMQIGRDTLAQGRALEVVKAHRAFAAKASAATTH